MTIHAYSVQDAYIYGFALQEKSLPGEPSEQIGEVAQMMIDQFEDRMGELSAAGYPYLAEVVAGYVTQSGYNFADEFEFGLDLILDSLEKLRDTT